MGCYTMVDEQGIDRRELKSVEEVVENATDLLPSQGPCVFQIPCLFGMLPDVFLVLLDLGPEGCL